MTQGVRIALDAMGGDRAPRVVIEGAIQAASIYDYQLILVGDTRKINKFLKLYDYPKEKISIEHASQRVKMDEAPAASFRKKKDSSIAVGMRLLKEKKADIFVSAGNTGAVVAAATLMLRLLPHVEKTGIAVIFPTLKEPTLLIDAGANIGTKAIHMFQYAVMGEAYMHYILKVEKPSIFWPISMASIAPKKEVKAIKKLKSKAFFRLKPACTKTPKSAISWGISCIRTAIEVVMPRGMLTRKEPAITMPSKKL